ncbi:hypothetical protein FQN54_006480 [Arachnomyces sp. PD_36]|nr:hypothetical protein FQN54_006480 [Arachnomyces sp. PD_36]
MKAMNHNPPAQDGAVYNTIPLDKRGTPSTQQIDFQKMSLENLATELLRQILLNLDSSDLHDAALVCRSWLPLCREIHWSRISLNININRIKLVSILRKQGDSTSIPRQILGITIEEDNVLEYAEDEEIITAWRDDLLMILNHFDSIDNLRITFLDLPKFSQAPEQILRPDMVVSQLVIQRLTAKRLSDVLPYVLSPSLEFLGLGSCEFLDKEDTAVDDRLLSTDPKPLARLKHLVVFGDCGPLLPALVESASLDNLKTIVTVCQDKYLTSRLVKASSFSLRALALEFSNEGKYLNGPFNGWKLIDLAEAIFDLSTVGPLENLSIDISSYRRVEPLLSNLVQTVSSVQRLEHLFINCSPVIIDSDAEHENAVPLWKALDSHLAQLPGLEYVAFTLVITPGIAMFAGSGLGDAVEKFKGDVLNYAEAKLPACQGKKLIQVKDLVGSWTVQPFPDAKLSE